MERRLAAILAADVVGYSRLIRADEEGTLERLAALREEIIDPNIAKHHGRIVKLMGDGMLAEFPSVVDAVRAAAEVQQEVAERNASLPQEQRIEFRVGVNLGDVVIDGDDIHGDGVNVAARLEGLAQPGGICVSGSVHEQIRDRLDLPFSDMGEQAIKNIDRPVRVWQWPEQTEDRLSPTPAKEKIESETEPPEVPSLAILPFRTVGEDAERTFLADGLAEELNTMLGQISGLMVISRASTSRYRETDLDLGEVAGALGARYVLQGSLRASGPRVRISAQLINATTGVQLWAERYDNKIDDVFDLQDDLSREIVTALRLRLTDGEQARLWLRSTDNFTAWRAAMRGADLVWQGTPTAMARARELFQQAVGDDPEYAAAFGYLATTHYFDLRFGFSGDPETTRAAMIANADKALSLDPKNAYALLTKGAALTFEDRFDEAITFIKASIASNPNDAFVRLNAARVLINADRPAEGEREIRMAMRLNPHHPVNYQSVLANALTDLGRYDEAADALAEVTARSADYIAAHLQRIYLGTLRNDEEVAKQAAAEVLRIDPDYTIAKAANYYLSVNEERKKAFLDSLRTNGIPE